MADNQSAATVAVDANIINTISTVNANLSNAVKPSGSVPALVALFKKINQENIDLKTTIADRDEEIIATKRQAEICRQIYSEKYDEVIDLEWKVKEHEETISILKVKLEAQSSRG